MEMKDRQGLVILVVAVGTLVNTVTLVCLSYCMVANHELRRQLDEIRRDTKDIRTRCCAEIQQNGVGNQVVTDGGRDARIRAEMERLANERGNMR